MAAKGGIFAKMQIRNVKAAVSLLPDRSLSQQGQLHSVPLDLHCDKGHSNLYSTPAAIRPLLRPAIRTGSVSHASLPNLEPNGAACVWKTRDRRAATKSLRTGPFEMALLEIDANGLYCAEGDFYVDPWRGVERAVITHGHSDHARWGSGHYLTSTAGTEIVRARVGDAAAITGIGWGESVTQHGVEISFHPAGHILGSAQVRVAHRGEVWVVSGDFKTEPDATCEPFEPVRCHTFITESTFGLPIYVWRPQREIFAEIDAWWRANQVQGRSSVLFAYALGKAQRLLAGVDSTIGPIAVHGAVHRFVDLYREAGIPMPTVLRGDEEGARAVRGKGLVIAPPSAANSTWLRKFGDVSTAFASGWMQVRGIRRRRAADRGFVLSDHADWPGLLDTIRATGAEHVAVTHGPAVPALVRYLQEERGLAARALVTPYGDDEETGASDEAASQEADASGTGEPPTRSTAPNSRVLENAEGNTDPSLRGGPLSPPEDTDLERTDNGEGRASR